MDFKILFIQHYLIKKILPALCVGLLVLLLILNWLNVLLQNVLTQQHPKQKLLHYSQTICYIITLTNKLFNKSTNYKTVSSKKNCVENFSSDC